MLLADIVLAINLTAPQMINQTAEWYGHIIEKQANRFEINPLLIVSVITHESQWSANKISSDQEDFGLMQVRAKYCHTPPDHLLNPIVNIQIGAALLKSNYNFCKKVLDMEPETNQFMTCYAGSCWPISKACRPTKISKDFQNHVECLEQALTERVSLNCNKIFWNKI